MISIRKIKTITNIKLSVLFAAAALIVGIIPASTANAAAPEDTYTWQSDIPTACPEQPSGHCYASSVAYRNGRVYVGGVINPATPNPGPIGVFDTSGNLLMRIGSDVPDGVSGGFQALKIALDPTGIIYALDWLNNRIVVFNPDGSMSRQISLPTTDPPTSLISIAVDASGNIYGLDTASAGIVKLDPTGNITANLATGQLIGGGDIVLDSAGNIYATDLIHVKKFDPSGNLVFSVGSDVFGNGPGEFGSPFGITLDSAGNIYVMDTLNNRVQKLDPSGNYLSQFGVYGTGNGQFSPPSGTGRGSVAVDSSTNTIYVADQGNFRASVWKAALPPTDPGDGTPPAQPPAETLPDTGDNAVLIGLAGLGVVLIGGALFVLLVRSRRHVR